MRSLINKLNLPSFKKDIVEEAKLGYKEPNFKYKLNTKAYLVPFKNGVFNMYTREFRQTERDDYVNLTFNFDYDPSIKNEKVITFIKQILPNKRIREYVLSEFAKCLNGEIPNTKFLIFVGKGANGKSHTLLTRKRNNPNETSTEKLKLLNKRFAFLSEPEEGEKFNVACNEVPKVKNEDAVWRRLRVIDFTSKFKIDPDPNVQNEFILDPTIPFLMRKDVTWKQTFMNILLEYSNVDIEEPPEVDASTANYRKNNDEFIKWCEENIEFYENGILKMKELCERRFPNGESLKKKGVFIKDFEEFLKKTFPKIDTTQISSSHKSFLQRMEKL
ncbi:hypothetical protein HK099_005354 [Clydaea vesicula]|uniref:Bacteriophage/plasmid primase P4 C-terminal domain-containing protein n=1 Tax=Clydaea vesicula TaxID=447962 RepID=A0AAD5U1S7_9FUNG|nr:hypothetical protein HK099_005354 [Clydaea vesicula]